MTDIEIIKNPSEDIDQFLPKKKFPRMPVLYLEFLENKEKVNPNLINKPYEPDVENYQSDYQANYITNNQTNTNNQPDKIENNDLSEETTTKDRLNELLGDDIDETDHQSVKIAPTLNQIEKERKKKFLRRDIPYATEEDEEFIKERNEVFFHYEVLKRMHPTANIPEFTMYSDPKIMAQKYELLSKKLSLDSSVENWKRYMIVFVMGCEILLGKLNLDMEGFAQQQIVSMNTYDQLLVEMAEKSYTPTSSKWPVEVRLLMTVSINIAIFIISKMILKKTGHNLLGTINNFTNPLEKKMKTPEEVNKENKNDDKE